MNNIHHENHEHDSDGRMFGRRPRRSDRHFDRFGRSPHGHGHGFGAGPSFAPGYGPGPGFGPGFRGGPRRARKGDVRGAILSLLGENPSNGYGLIKAIAEKTGGSWRPSPGSVYPTLQQLVDEDLIASSGAGRKTVFELTEEGRKYVADNADELEKAWSASQEHSESHGEFRESIGALFGVIQQFRGASEKQLAAAKEVLDETRRALYRILAD